MLIFGHLNINSLKKKLNVLSKQIKESTDILMISETKLDGSFPEVRFLIACYHVAFRFDRNKNGEGIMLCAPEFLFC